MSDRGQLTPEERALGMGTPITRRDFVNASMVGTGMGLLRAGPLAALAGCAPARQQAVTKDAWYGYGARGDYARASGNTREVMEAAHRIRDGIYNEVPRDAVDTGEVFDMVIVGGGMSGLGAAHFFAKHAPANQRCLLLENHLIFGGEAKENHFLVDGQVLIAPQGSNDFGAPARGSGGLTDTLFDELNIPRDFEFVEWASPEPPLRFARDNYANMVGIGESQVDVGYFFEGQNGGQDRWVVNMWRDDLRDAPYPEDVKRDLLKWRYSRGETTPEFRQLLDSMTYKDFIEKVMKLSPEVTRMAEPVVGLINGASPDAVSAFAASQIGMPGAGRARAKGAPLPLSFPGGNSAFARFFVKALIPGSIGGQQSFVDVLNSPVNFDALDVPTNRISMRVGATVVRVEHDGPTEQAGYVWITYEKDGKPYRLRARGVVMASGGWVNQHIIRDLPPEIKEAYTHFHHSPALIANVALTNWRFMYKRGITAADWFGNGFGFTANLRQPMVVGEYRPSMDPDKPTVLTFYAGIYKAGLSVYDQGVQGRNTLFSTPFAEYERQIRAQMVRMFGATGFDPERDIAGLILNRWGHARLVQQPGFYFGTNGHTPPRKVVEAGFGRIAIGHSELNGHQSWTGGVTQGYRAAEQVLQHKR